MVASYYVGRGARIRLGVLTPPGRDFRGRSFLCHKRKKPAIKQVFVDFTFLQA